MQGSLLPIGLGGGGGPVGQLATAINSEFSSFPQFQVEFRDLAVRTGVVGFIWLVSVSTDTLTSAIAIIFTCMYACRPTSHR
jgi:superoxide dismutase